MSAYKDGNYLTEKGRALMAKLMAAQSKIEFTRVTVGSGSIPEGSAPKNMERLSKYEADGVISEISTPAAGEVHLVFQVFSKDVSVGFLATEAAVWAKDPDEGEILYTYIVLDNEPEFIRSSSDPVQKFAEFTCINIVGSVAADLTVVNPDAICTRGMFEDWKKEFTVATEQEVIDMAKELMKNSAGGSGIIIPGGGGGGLIPGNHEVATDDDVSEVIGTLETL